MPIITESQLDSLAQTPETNQGIYAPKEDDQDVGFLDTLNAWFDRENFVYNATKNLTYAIHGPAYNPEFDEKFNPFDHIDGYEQHAERFVGVPNRQELEILKQKISREDEVKQTIEKSDTYASLVGALSAGIIDVTSLIPGAKGVQLGRAGVRTAKAAGTAALYGAGAAGVTELSLGALQETRTTEEMAWGTLSGAAFGAILGGAGAALSNPARIAGKNALRNALQGKDYKLEVSEKGVNVVRDRSVGAAERGPEAELEAEGLAYINDKLAKTLAGANIRGLTPVTIRGLTSQDETVRALTNSLFVHGNIVGKETQGISRGFIAEDAIRLDTANIHLMNKKIENLFLAHTEVGKFKSAVATPEGKLSFSEFQERIAIGLRDGQYKDDIAEVQQATDILRKELDHWAGQLQKVGLLADLDPSKMSKYLSRVYNKKYLVTREGSERFHRVAQNWVKHYKKDGTKRTRKLSDTKAREEASKIYNNIMGTSDEAVESNNPFLGFSKGRFTKERAWMIDDSEINEFLVNDAQYLVNNYAYKASQLVRTQEALQKLGFEDIGALKAEINNNYTQKKRSAKTDKELTKLEEQRNIDLGLADDMYALMLGQLKKPGRPGADQFTETLLNYQYMTMLGNVTISSLPEIAMAPFNFGLMRTLVKGWVPLVRGFKTAKASRDQLKSFGVGLEAEMSNVMHHITGIGDGSPTQYDTMWSRIFGEKGAALNRLFGSTADLFSKATLISHWTAAGRRLAGHVAITDIYDTLRKTNKTQKDIEKLANIGISKTDHDLLLKYLNQHMDIEKGSYFANAHLWDKGLTGMELVEARKAIDIFSRAVRRSVDDVVLKPGRGELPLFANASNLGRIIFQFKSFMSAASSRIFIKGIQRRDSNVFQGLVALVALGTLSTAMKDVLAGRELEENSVRLLTEGVSNSGILGLIAGTPLNLGLVATNDRSRRYTGSTVVGQVFGPTAGTLESIGTVGANMANGKLSQSDQKRMASLIWFNNIHAINLLKAQIWPEKESNK